ncbi:ComEA family DNA-binding protein [uncultured Arthrobacter sp.]|uniref:ComEA family DNA-binding protein n=1 Tax=uncultured Arthrobacter sp. TaxID=114050 RepID=UPI00262B457C|nr:ComEA family DNA-binding protein [uncultured Arthrobacter sp.]
MDTRTAGGITGARSVHSAGLRWRVGRSAALVFLGVALAVGAALFLVRSSEPSAAALSVELDATRPTVSGPTVSGSSAASAPPGTPVGTPPAVDGPVGPDTGGGPGSGTAGGPPGQDGAGTIVVYVTGAVAAPGVVTVRNGTRLGEILEEVGGALPDADLEIVNLAAPPVDGQHIHVLAVGEEPRIVPGEQPAVLAPASGPGPTTGGPIGSGDGQEGGPGQVIDLNTATLAQLETLPRVGPVLGQRIIDWREDNGPFLQAEDIDAVPGIGPAMLEGILPLVSVR